MFHVKQRLPAAYPFHVKRRLRLPGALCATMFHVKHGTGPWVKLSSLTGLTRTGCGSTSAPTASFLREAWERCREEPCVNARGKAAVRLESLTYSSGLITRPVSSLG
jgi:hypothetical protein